MTEPTDSDNDLAVTSRRRFLREGSALMGGAVLGIAQTMGAKPRLDRPVETRPRPPQSDVPRPPGSIPQSGGFYGWQR